MPRDPRFTDAPSEAVGALQPYNGCHHHGCPASH